jgi:hypothetical protein
LFGKFFSDEYGEVLFKLREEHLAILATLPVLKT